MKNRVGNPTRERQTKKPADTPARITVRVQLPAALRARVDRTRKAFGLTRGEFLRLKAQTMQRVEADPMKAAYWRGYRDGFTFNGKDAAQ